MDRDAFIAERLTGIGGSDAASVCNVSPYKSAYELYREKVGDIGTDDDPEPTERMLFGTLLEDVIAQEFGRRMDVKVRRRNAMLRHRKWDWMVAHPDRTIDGRKAGLEAKCAGELAYRFGDWDDTSDGIPTVYRMQVAHYMAVLDYDLWYLAVLIGGHTMRIYEIERDRELEEEMIELEHAFWDRVVRRDPPPIDYDNPRAIALLQRLFPKTDGQTITYPDEALHWHHVLVDSGKMRDAYEHTHDTAKAHLLHLLGSHAVALLPDGSGSYRRKEVQRGGYTVEPCSYVDFRYIKPKKEAA